MITTFDCITPEGIRTFNSLLEGSHTLTVTTHTHPDGDALGSASALVCHLRQARGMDAVAVLPDSPSSTVRPIIPDGAPFLFLDTEPEACLERIRRSDLVILLDGNGFSRTEGLQAAFEASGARKVLIDHHLNPEKDSFGLVFSTPDISSASELLFFVLMELPEVGGDAARLPADTARALMTGMTTDTNNFANSVFPSTFQMASELIAAGVDRDALIGKIYQSYRENRVRLMGYMQSEELHILDNGTAYMVLTRDIQERFDMRDGESEGLVNVPLTIEKVRLSVLLKEDDGHFRVSVRSKKGTSAQQLAQRFFHGGGHENAAGGKMLIGEDIPSADAAPACLEQVLKDYLK